MFKKDKGIFYRNAKDESKKKGKKPKTEHFFLKIFGKGFGKITPKPHKENGVRRCDAYHNHCRYPGQCPIRESVSSNH